MTDDHPQLVVGLLQQQDYRFEVSFGAGIAALLADESPPLGGCAGPSPVQLLAAAVGNCLGASLTFALRKFKERPAPLQCNVAVDVGRNAQGRLRVRSMDARLTLGEPAKSLPHLTRALAQFADFCTVTQSLREAVAVSVRVFDSQGVQLQ